MSHIKLESQKKILAIVVKLAPVFGGKIAGSCRISPDLDGACGRRGEGLAVFEGDDGSAVGRALRPGRRQGRMRPVARPSHA